MEKDKKETFLRLAEKRTQDCLDMIRKIENLANRNNYDYTEEQVERIFAALRGRLDAAEVKFSKGRVEEDRFRL